MSHSYHFFKIDSLNTLVCLGIGLFTLLTLVYSIGFMKGRKGLFKYYLYIVLTALASVLTVLSNNLILLLIFWGFLGLTLYLLINMNDEASAVAKKTFIIVGGSDALMLLGIGLLYYLCGTMQMDNIKLGFNSGLAVLAYLGIAIACFAKAGVMPFHSWIPDCAKQAPVPVVAYLPASLDKLLGIYLLARISLDMFVMNNAMNAFLMVTGVFTIIAAAMTALVQHDMKRLLGYSTVSQVGYMVLGIGTANPIGIAGGILHMFNHAIYKSCLFFTSGNVEQSARTTELGQLGGLAKTMPLTYFAALIASLSISGLPPFNGFFSKWMIYQGLVSQSGARGAGLRLISVLCLAGAMFGSGLTLASFMKLLHAAYLGQPAEKIAGKRPVEVSWQMWFPGIVLSLLCIFFGVFAYRLPLKHFIYPAIPGASPAEDVVPRVSLVLLALGLATGFAVYYASAVKKVARKDEPFAGGEPLSFANKVPGTEFYNTVREWGILDVIYRKAEAGLFDIYEQSKKLIFSLGGFFQYLHNGVLPTYLVWTLLGMIGLFWFLIR